MAGLTGADVKPARIGRRLQDWPVLSWDRVRVVGDRVAAVAADTREIADEALARISVDYEELPAVFDPESALAPDAPVLHPDSAEELVLGGARTPVPHPNVQGYALHEHGDVHPSVVVEPCRLDARAADVDREHVSGHGLIRRPARSSG